MENHSKLIAKALIDIKAFILSPDNLFTWASGIKSPVYCDNRLSLSYPTIRELIVEGFTNQIEQNFKDVEVIAGVATAGIPYASMVAQKLNLPLIYVRSKAKGHGRENKIEGQLQKGQRVIVIEDLISTGGSCLKAAEAITMEQADVLTVMAIFSYGFAKATQNFKASKMSFVTLTNFETLIAQCIDMNVITQDESQFIHQWIKAVDV
ncbi:MAG: orotate phosphoribosyltransferase [Bacteriovoracaceae bacterium]|nr:orotate phosphoribosyltransferase [Bacteriovoracaceae bacterium]